ncbi:MAG: flagellar basal body P-ring protein FlgI [Spirochaetia bacterium]|nr:flagellar basal body P-ring protein FlgI [Spirochaetia bacterium]
MKFFIQIFFIIIIFSNSVYSLSLSIGEITKISSFRENHLVGFGLVVGLKQTGDSRSVLGLQALVKLLKQRGIEAKNDIIKSKNIAAVMVMANIPPLAKRGDTIDIWVASIGDAKSIEGGYLMQTPLFAADGIVYAAAQSAITDSNQTTKKNKNTVRVIKGAIIEKPIVQPMINLIENKRELSLSLINFDINTADNIINSVNNLYSNSTNLDPDGTIVIKIPENEDSVKFISNILDTKVQVKTRAKIVIDSNTGTIVMGGGVGLSAVAVNKENINIKIGQNDKTNTQRKGNVYIEETATVKELVEALNSLGMPAFEIIDIIKTIHSSGSLHGELIIQ